MRREMRGPLAMRSTSDKRHAERQDLQSDNSSSASTSKKTKPKTKKEITENPFTDECENLCMNTHDQCKKSQS